MNALCSFFEAMEGCSYLGQGQDAGLLAGGWRVPGHHMEHLVNHSKVF